MKKSTVKLSMLFGGLISVTTLLAQQVSPETESFDRKIIPSHDPITGGITHIMIENDPFSMNWIITADETQYHWIGKSYQWGLGELVINDGGSAEHIKWTQAEKIEGNSVVFNLNSKIELTVTRHHEGNDFIEEYNFKNITNCTHISKLFFSFVTAVTVTAIT